MPRPPRHPSTSQKSTVRGVGWNALLACVILYAVRDVIKAPTPKIRNDAYAFLASAACDELLDHLGMPSNTVLLAKIGAGIDADLLDQMGGYTSNDNALKQKERQRQKRVSKKMARTLLSSTTNLILC